MNRPIKRGTVSIKTTMNIDRRFNYSGAIYDDNGSITRFYDREVDDYRQDHYQLHISQQLSAYWNANLSFHYTDGKGYFEQYQQRKSFADLGLPDVTIGDTTIESSDVIVRRWLDNDYYGTTFSANYIKNKTNLTFGGAFSKYDNARISEKSSGPRWQLTRRFAMCTTMANLKKQILMSMQNGITL